MQWEKFHCLPAHLHDLFTFLFFSVVYLFIFFLSFLFIYLSLGLFVFILVCLYLQRALTLILSLCTNSISGCLCICICESLYLGSPVFSGSQPESRLHRSLGQQPYLSPQQLGHSSRSNSTQSYRLTCSLSSTYSLFESVSLFVLISSQKVQFPVLLFFYLYPCMIHAPNRRRASWDAMFSTFSTLLLLHGFLSAGQ